MRNTLFLIVVLISCNCQAQDTLFNIISVKGIVVLDEDTVRCGQYVTSVSRELKITGKGSYATILTEKGFAFQTGRGKFKVKEISNADFSNLVRRYAASGAVMRNSPASITLAGFHNEQNRFVLGDSLTVVARPYDEGVKQYKVIMVNVFNEQLSESVSASHVQTVNISNLFDNYNTLLFRVETDKKKVFSKLYMLKKILPKDSLEFHYDLQCSNAQNFVEKELSMLALCEIHELYYDQLYHLHRLWKYSTKNGIEIKHGYYKRLFDLYDLTKFLPIPLTGY